jgi:glycerol-3-phosphate acyltransferase PlsY
MEPGAALAAAVSIVAAYLIGAIPFGVVVARAIGGQDPRSVGSGRTGGANTLRALGIGPAVAAGALDTAKGAVAVLIPIALGAGLLVQVVCALLAILGHSRSIYIHFGGGRGVAPGFGTALVLQPWVAVVMLPVYVGILATTRYSSLGSISAAAAGGVVLIVVSVVNHMAPEYVLYGVGAPALIWLFHFDNIQRLVAGQERRMAFRR